MKNCITSYRGERKTAEGRHDCVKGRPKKDTGDILQKTTVVCLNERRNGINVKQETQNLTKYCNVIEWIFIASIIRNKTMMCSRKICWKYVYNYVQTRYGFWKLIVANFRIFSKITVNQSITGRSFQIISFTKKLINL